MSHWRIKATCQDNFKFEVEIDGDTGEVNIIDKTKTLTVTELTELKNMAGFMDQLKYVKMECKKESH